jgi:cobalamin biosynthesis protein CobD/CbiB
MNNYKLGENIKNLQESFKKNSQEIFGIIGKISLLTISIYLLYQLIVYLNSILKTIEPGISIILDFIILASFLILLFNQNRLIKKQNNLLQELLMKQNKPSRKSKGATTNKK